jgi:hypothetical protein
MISTLTSDAFMVDDEGDRELSSDGCSRYGAYLRQRSEMFRDSETVTDDVLRFALAAWQIAQSPIMSPGYVRSHSRVVGNGEYWDDEGRPSVTVQIAMPLPASLARSAHCSAWRSWERQQNDQRWIQPYDNDGPAAFNILVVRVPLQAVSLPLPEYRSDAPATSVAKSAVRTICDLINDEVRPILVELRT